MDERREARSRQLDVFKSLMAHRRAFLSAERVKALNMVEIEFYGIEPVQRAYREAMNHINLPKPLPDNWADEQRKYITKLLTEMALVLGYRLQQLDVFDGGYYPDGLAELDKEQQSVRRSLIEVLSGRRPLIVSQGAATPPAPFPPPPMP
jgi:hypothetical protein